RWGGEPAAASPKPLFSTVRVLREVLTLPLPSPVAVPLPKPVLATTPRTPFPPVPLPLPSPVGRSNDPDCAMFTGLVFVSCAGTPFGSPNPPVCTFFG